MKTESKARANRMPDHAKTYVAVVATLGTASLAFALARWTSPDLTRFLLFLGITLVGATWKVRLPGMTSTISASFLFVLLGIAEFSLSETLVAGCAATIVQSIWHAQRRPQPVQLLFNVASWAISIDLAYELSHLLVPDGPLASVIRVGLGAALFFAAHMGMLGVIVALTESKTVRGIWRHLVFYTFTYYLVGAALAGVINYSSKTLGLFTAMLVLPLMYLASINLRVQMEQIPATSLSDALNHKSEE